MAVKFDNIHWTSRRIDGYDKSINFIYGPREPGKTAYMFFKKIYSGWLKDKAPWIYIVRQCVEITNSLIETIFETNINKFLDEPITAQYKESDLKNGVVDIKINGEMFIRIVSLSIPLRRIKLAVLRNCKSAYFDEYVIDPKTGEKYGKDEFYKIKEAFTTWRRECGGKFKLYFTANNYSEYNPVFTGLGVEGNKIKKGEILVGDYWAIEKVVISPELKAYLLEKNPFYKFDDNYSSYALEGEAINDANIILGNQPKNFSLSYLFKVQGQVIGIFKNNMYMNNGDYKFYCQFMENYKDDRTVYCFDFDELVNQCALLSHEDRFKFANFKKALQRNLVVFNSIAVYYLVIEIYQFI